jgi:hypothetical protein
MKQLNDTLIGSRMTGRGDGRLGVGGTWSSQCEGPLGSEDTVDCSADIVNGRLICLTGKRNAPATCT